MYTKIVIPEYVKSEILNRDNADIQKAINSFINVVITSNDQTDKIAKKHGIHIGEAHVKTLGEELKSSLFLSNEKKVRKTAKDEGFKVVGTIGIILRSVKKGIIEKSEAYSILKKMKSQYFRIHPDIIEKALIVLKDI
ncbi:MAG: DUF3368 domain-containing protein [Nitrospinae bacterium]|nr:DUF3368 domain-containing protein [Nitrospinota bacterium]